jgi:hypothetical protein
LRFAIERLSEIKENVQPSLDDFPSFFAQFLRKMAMSVLESNEPYCEETWGGSCRMPQGGIDQHRTIGASYPLMEWRAVTFRMLRS